MGLGLWDVEICFVVFFVVRNDDSFHKINPKIHHFRTHNACDMPRKYDIGGFGTGLTKRTGHS
jgi:hypothetical protein